MYLITCFSTILHIIFDLLYSFTKYSDTLCRPYFEEKARYNSLLDTQKNKVQALEKDVSNAKLTYSQALRNLEKISEEIHRHRSSFMSQNAPTSSSKETNTAASQKKGLPFSFIYSNFANTILVIFNK